jgi:hypothetical protein
VKTLLALASVSLLLAACGRAQEHPGAASVTAHDNAACALIGDGTRLFGAGAQHFGYRGLDRFAASCEYSSADGRRGGEIILYTPESLHHVSPQAEMQTVTATWADQADTPLAAVEGVGDAAQIATGLPGYQTQIAFRKGSSLVLIAGRSGDSTVTGEQIARGMAALAATQLPSAQ